MKSFKEFLTEGGNVQIDGKEAQRIDLTKIDRGEIVPVLFAGLKAISKGFETFSGFPLWGAEVLKDKTFLSGSAFHFFNTDTIPHNEFKSKKPTVGDIDTQVDGEQKERIKNFLTASAGKTFGPLKLIGFKPSADQFISLWDLEQFNISIQIDFELVSYANGRPTPWAQFSHSSSWADLKEGIKGVAQKYLMRALDAPNIRSVIVRSKTGKEKEIVSSDYAFSVSHGVRRKLDKLEDATPTKLPVYKELSTAESKGTTDLDKIFQHYFSRSPSKQEVEDMASFVGLINLIKTNLSKSVWGKIADGFARTLWGPGAQGLYRNDKLADFREKNTMMRYLCNQLDIDIKKYDPMIEEYYK